MPLSWARGCYKDDFHVVHQLFVRIFRHLGVSKIYLVYCVVR
jgi:hypothetical protein